MSDQPVISIPPVADPIWPMKPATSSLVIPEGTFTEEDLNFLESTLWFYEENDPTARGSEQNMERLVRVRALLAGFTPTSS
jgi:hypothetical protein